MFHLIKRSWVVLALMLAGTQTMFGFAYLGPLNEAFQVPAIGYGLTPPASSLGDDGGGTDLGGPKNFGMGYRWNTPTNWYAYDESFIRYFGATGQSNIDEAFQMFNNLGTLNTNNLNDWPLFSSRINQEAAALQLIDLRSATMSVIIEQLGLAQPERWTWCLHDRFPVPGAPCPNFEYLIIQRNFDPYTQLYSSYVNDILYDYQIVELCGNNPNVFAPLVADAIEFPVDLTQDDVAFGAVSDYLTLNLFGSFYQSFTRDDIGGLLALYSPTNAYPEIAETNSVQVLTNTTSPVLIVTSNLALFEEQALTNTDAALQALYPGLVIIPGLTTNSFTNVVTTNITAYLTNPPFAPAGTVQLVLATNFTTNVQTLFFHTYANLEIVKAYSAGFVTEQITSVQPKPFAPAGTFYTNVTTIRRLESFTNGAFYILPTNLCGPYEIVKTQLVQVVATTNFIPIFTNTVTLFTNAQSTNFTSVSFITYATNYFLVGYPVDCITNTSATREGMNGFHFLRRDDWDSVAGQLVTPITNIYQLTAISNGSPVVQTFRRILTRPDILIVGEDGPLTGGPAGSPGVSALGRSPIRFVTNDVPPTAAGPGTIEPTGLQFSYNTVGPIYINVGPFFTEPGAVIYPQTNSLFLFQWGSFDATTNAPILYPDTNSIAQAEANLFYQITTSMLPDASISANGPGNPYSYTLQTGGNLVPPFNWTLAQGSGGLPPGMTLSTDGTISGSPTALGTYDFTVQVMDTYGKIAQKALFITVDP